MNKKKSLQKQLTCFPVDDTGSPCGPDGRNISESIEYLKKSGIEDLTQKMLRDMDSIVSPFKRTTKFRYYDFDALSKVKVIMVLKAVGFSNKKIVHMFQLRADIITLIDKLSPGIDNITLRGTGGTKPADVLWRKTQDYLSILHEVFVRIDKMKKIIQLANDFYSDEDERARSLVG